MTTLRVFHRLFLRPLVHDWLRTSLTVFAVAIGVAVVLAISLAGRAATGSFLSSVESLAGKADLEVTATGGVPGSVVAKLITLPRPLKVEPRIEDYAMAGKEMVPLLGIDLVADAAHGTAERGNLQWLEKGDCVWVSPGLARPRGSTIRLQLNDHSADFKVCGVLNSAASQRGGLIVMDIALAMRELGRKNRVDEVLITLPKQSTLSFSQWEQILRRALPPGVSVQPYGAQAKANRRMLDAFRWNLRILSYIALLVGAFLIYNNLSVSVVRRRAEIGILRALGASRRLIGAGFLGEAAIYGIVGSALGLVLGRFMAQGAVGMIAATVQSLYLTSQPAPISLTPSLILLAFAIGIGVALVSAILPAREAARVAPVEAMARARREYEVRIAKLRHLLIAAVCAIGGAAAAQAPALGGKPLLGYLAALLLVAACVFAIPAFVVGFASLLSPLVRRAGSVEPYLALRTLTGSLRRTSVLLAALATAIAMVVSVGIMVGSFRETVAVWLNNQLQADFYVQPAEPAGVDRYPTMSPEITERVAALPEVRAAGAIRTYPITVKGAPATLAGADTRVLSRYGRTAFVRGENSKSIFARLEAGSSVAVSEPFAIKHGIHSGETLRLPMPQGAVAFRVAGIYHDYSDPRGVILMDRNILLKYLPDPGISGLAIFLKPGVEPDAARGAILQACAGRRVTVVSNRALRTQALRVFDRTFRITYALEAIALAIAVIGMAGALLALVADRRRELGILRFLGCSARQIRKLILCEAAFIGILAILAGFVLGVLLSLILIFVINKQSFGWTIQFHWPVAVLVGAILIIYASTLAAGFYPARLGARLDPIEAVREE
ncbi:MAG TPA: FtsX-like permease family protein [Terriglobia bacterium]|nr:FtsX-like permease family protein [Terriglobia bacterium]